MRSYRSFCEESQLYRFHCPLQSPTFPSQLILTFTQSKEEWMTVFEAAHAIHNSLLLRPISLHLLSHVARLLINAALKWQLCKQ